MPNTKKTPRKTPARKAARDPQGQEGPVPESSTSVTNKEAAALFVEECNGLVNNLIREMTDDQLDRNGYRDFLHDLIRAYAPIDNLNDADVDLLVRTVALPGGESLRDGTPMKVEEVAPQTAAEAYSEHLDLLRERLQPKELYCAHARHMMDEDDQEWDPPISIEEAWKDPEDEGQDLPLRGRAKDLFEEAMDLSGEIHDRQRALARKLIELAAVVPCELLAATMSHCAATPVAVRIGKDYFLCFTRKGAAHPDVPEQSTGPIKQTRGRNRNISVPNWNRLARTALEKILINPKAPALSESEVATRALGMMSNFFICQYYDPSKGTPYLGNVKVLMRQFRLSYQTARQVTDGKIYGKIYGKRTSDAPAQDAPEQEEDEDEEEKQEDPDLPDPPRDDDNDEDDDNDNNKQPMKRARTQRSAPEPPAKSQPTQGKGKGQGKSSSKPQAGPSQSSQKTARPAPLVKTVPAAQKQIQTAKTPVTPRPGLLLHREWRRRRPSLRQHLRRGWGGPRLLRAHWARRPQPPSPRFLPSPNSWDSHGHRPKP